MIYTLTVNPSLDYMIKLDALRIGEIQRTSEEEIIYGGKGINVSRMLQHLGLSSIAYGFVGGESAQMYVQGVIGEGIHASFLPVKKGFTRINVKIFADQETQINGQGPQPDATELEEMLQRLSQLGQGDILVIAGSMQSSIPDTYYAQIVRMLQANGALCIVDTSNAALLHVLEEKPFLIKPNIQELEELFRCPMREGILFSSMQALQQKGVRNVLVSCGDKGAYLLDEQGAIYYGKSVTGKVVSTIGCGDAMVGGFLYGWMEKNEYVHAFRMGLAAGSASAFTSGIADGEAVRALLDRVEIEVLRTPVKMASQDE